MGADAKLLQIKTKKYQDKPVPQDRLKTVYHMHTNTHVHSM